MNVIVEDYDAHHHSHTEEHGVRVGEPTAVFPGNKERSEGKCKDVFRQEDEGGKGKLWKHLRSLQHDTAHTGHGAQTVRGVLYGQGLILKKKKISILYSTVKYRVLPQGGERSYLQNPVKHQGLRVTLLKSISDPTCPLNCL